MRETDIPTHTRRMRCAIIDFLRLLKTFGVVVAPPVLRVALALPFLRSGFTRWDGFLSLSPGTIYLFEEQFKLHLFGGLYSFPAPLINAYIVGVAELAFPTLLIIGLGTRFAATGLLVMTGVIQLTDPDGWANFHLYWAAMALAIMALGAGPVSVDGAVQNLTHIRESSATT
jgi:putative oxidoreductase